MPSEPSPARPLSGLRAVDFSTTLTGANISLFLADFGAEVFHVEPPGGSPLRSQPAWPMWGRGQKSIELDLGHPADRAVAQHLAAASDIVVETFRPGVADRLGIGYDELSARRPGVVHASVTGFGTQGPCAGVKGYEGLVFARLGAYTSFGGMVDRPGPAFTSSPYCAWSASQTALHGILAALYEREGSGLGQHVQTSLVQGIAAHDPWNQILQMLAQRYPGAYTSDSPVGPDDTPNTSMPLRLLVALTSDGRWLQFSQVQPRLFKAFLRALGMEHLLDEPEWKTAPEFDDVAARVSFWEQMLEAAHTRTVAEWQDVFAHDHDVWAEVFRSGSELLDHPQMLHDGQVVEIVDHEVGVVRQPGPLVKLALTPGSATESAPRRNEHDAELRALAASTASAANPAGAAEPAADRPAPASPAWGRTTVAPLAGVTVLELGTFYAGPYGATLLADLGARVIKAEGLEGDPMRMIVGFPEAGGAKVLQGKESVAVDMATDDGRAIVHELARRSDVVLRSFRAGVAERLGVDDVSLLAVNPDLVYLNAPGYGVDGPSGHCPAFAPTIGAGAGLAMRNAAGGVPERPDLTMAEIKHYALRLGMGGGSVGQADGFSALGVATGLLIGLVARRRGAPGQSMLTTMLSTLAHTLSEDMVEYAGRPPLGAVDPDLYGLGARYRLYEAADRWLFLAAPAPREWVPLAAALEGHVDLAGDARFATEADRVAHDAELAEVLAGMFRTRPAADWERDLTSADVGCMAVSDGPAETELMSDFGQASGYVVNVVHPTFDEYPRVAPLVSFSRSATVSKAGTLVGEATAAVLGELGYSPERIADLHRRGIVSAP